MPPEIQKQLDDLQTRRDGRVHWKNLKDDGCDLQAGTSGGVLETGDIIVWDDESDSFSNRALDDAVKQQVIVTGIIPYNANGSYDTTHGLSKDVSSAIPNGFTLVAVTATGYKAHPVTGDREEALPLILEPKVDGNYIRTRVWDAAGTEYGGPSWTTKTAQIDYTLFISR